MRIKYIARQRKEDRSKVRPIQKYVEMTYSIKERKNKGEAKERNINK